MSLIEKNGMVYTVDETLKYWALTTRYCKCNFTFNVPKSECQSIEQLRQYVKDNFMFG